MGLPLILCQGQKARLMHTGESYHNSGDKQGKGDGPESVCKPDSVDHCGFLTGVIHPVAR